MQISSHLQIHSIFQQVKIKDVEGTPMDFRTPTEIGKKADYSFDQIKNATGYDHNWCLNTYKDGKGDDKTICASLYSPKSGILLEVFTNEPGIQVYTGNFQGTGIACISWNQVS